MRRWSALFVVTVLLLGACGTPAAGPARSPAPTVDPWLVAVARAQAILEQAPDLEAHLQGYERQAAEISQSLAAVEQVRPALDLVDSLRRQSVFGLGNAWDALTTLLDASAPGSGQALATLDGLLRQILTFNDSLDALRSLEPVAAASRDFRANPSQETLLALEDGCKAAIPRLEAFDQELEAQIGALSQALGRAELVQRGLDGAAQRVGVPLVADAIRSLSGAVGSLASPVRSLRDGVQALRASLQADLRVMRSIQDAAEGARRPTASEGPGWGGGPFPWPALLAVLALAAFGLIVAVALRRSRGEQARREQPQAAVLLVLSGPLAGQTFPIPGPDVMVGRGAGCGVRIPDPFVSRRHLRLRFADGSWFVQDQGSKSGTMVNDQPVTATRLNPGDIIAIGDTRLQLHLQQHSLSP